MYYVIRRCVVVCVALLSITGCSDFFSSKVHSTAFDASKIIFDKETYPAVVLGGGVGGMTASVYLAMANIKTLLVQGSMPGGLLTQSLSVRNWPGEIELPGMAITDKLLAQARKQGVEVQAEQVVGVDTNVWPYLVALASLDDPARVRTVKALTVIIAMGALSNYLGIPGEKEYWSKGVTNCAVCEGGLYKDKTVCVIGGGNSAIEEAHYLAGIARKVYVFVRGNALRATDNRKDDLMRLSNVEFVYNTTVQSISGEDSKVTAIIVFDKKTNQEKKYDMDGVFLAIGFRPNTVLFKGKLALDDAGYIKLVRDQETTIPGVYAIGDIVDPVYKQAVTAAGDGCRAALQAHAFLVKSHYGVQPAPAAASVTKSVTIEPVRDEATSENKEDSYADGKTHEIKSLEEIQNLLKTSTVPVVIDFHATWCGPCRAMAPLYKKLAERYKDRVAFVKINIDDLGGFATQYRIQGVPTFVFVKEGAEQDRIVGGGSTEKQFAEKIDRLI